MTNSNLKNKDASSKTDTNIMQHETKEYNRIMHAYSILIRELHSFR